MLHASLYKSVGTGTLYKSVGAASLYKSVGAASLYKSMGDASLIKSMGVVVLDKNKCCTPVEVSGFKTLWKSRALRLCAGQSL